MIGSIYWKAALAFFGKWARHIPLPQKGTWPSFKRKFDAHQTGRAYSTGRALR